VLTALLVLCHPGAAAEPDGEQFIAVSDLHFDPMADSALVDRLAATAAGAWAGILAQPGATRISRYGQDTTYPLLQSALQEMRATLPHPAFLLVPGDFLAHSFRKKFDAAAAEHTDARYRAFVVKTMQFLAGQLQAAFPGTPILPVLGNNDDECGDYMLHPGGPFLRDALPIVRALLGGGVGANFDRDWTATGSYDVAHPTLPAVRVIFADTVFFSRNYRDACGAGGGDPGGKTLDWLRDRLTVAREAGQKVWLLYHIPPGIDVYATLHGAGCPKAMVPFWAPSYAVRFAELMDEFSGTVAASFAGHTHMDEFRLTGAAGGFVLVVPALSPIFGQNPAFQVFAYDAAGGVLDRTTPYLANVAAAAGGAAAEWRAEPSFTKTWMLPRVDGSTLQTLYDRIDGDRDAGTLWLLRYAASRAGFWPLPPEQGLVPKPIFAAYRCAIGNLSVAEFRACYCDASTSSLRAERSNPVLCAGPRIASPAARNDGCTRE